MHSKYNSEHVFLIWVWNNFLFTEQPKVAFSADLGIRGNLGPQTTEITLTFNNVFTNIGNNYNPTTGT